MARFLWFTVYYYYYYLFVSLFVTSSVKCRCLLQAVADVKSAGVDVELAIQDVRQRYEMLQRYKLPVSNDELKQLRSFKKLWNQLRERAHYTNWKLITVKSKFTSLAQLEISDFADEIRKLSNYVIYLLNTWL